MSERMLWISRKSEIETSGENRIKIDAHLKLMGIQYEENDDLIGFLHQKINSGFVFIEKKYANGGVLWLPIDFRVISKVTAEKAMSYIENALNRAEDDFKRLQIGYLQKA